MPQRRTSEDRHVIELRLTRLGQLFQSMDPQPFYDKDLDPDAEAFLTARAEDAPRRAPLAILVHLENPAVEDALTVIRDSVRNFYTRRAENTRRQLRDQLRVGRVSLLIGLLFLAACVGAYELSSPLGEGAWAEIIRQSLVIAGWVAMWRPLEIFLYDWWPVLARVHLFRRLAASDVRVEVRE